MGMMVACCGDRSDCRNRPDRSCAGSVPTCQVHCRAYLEARLAYNASHSTCLFVCCAVVKLSVETRFFSVQPRRSIGRAVSHVNCGGPNSGQADSRWREGVADCLTRHVSAWYIQINTQTARVWRGAATFRRPAREPGSRVAGRFCIPMADSGAVSRKTIALSEKGDA